MEGHRYLIREESNPNRAQEAGKHWGLGVVVENRCKTHMETVTCAGETANTFKSIEVFIPPKDTTAHLEAVTSELAWALLTSKHSPSYSLA